MPLPISRSSLGMRHGGSYKSCFRELAVRGNARGLSQHKHIHGTVDPVRGALGMSARGCGAFLKSGYERDGGVR
jgi:hypothetical protein